MPILSPSPCLTPRTGNNSPFFPRSRASSSVRLGSSPPSSVPHTPSVATSSCLSAPPSAPNQPPVLHKSFNVPHGVILYTHASSISQSPPTYFRVEPFRLQAHSSVLARMMTEVQKSAPIPLTPPLSDNGEDVDEVEELETRRVKGEVLIIEEDAKVVEMMVMFMYPPTNGVSKGYTRGRGMDLNLEYDLAVELLQAVDKYGLYAARSYAIETLAAHLNSWGDRSIEIYGLAHRLGYEELAIEAAEHSISFDIARVEPEVMDAIGPIAAVEIYRHHALHSRRRRVTESIVRALSRLPPPVAAPTLVEHTSGVCWAELAARWSRFCDELLLEVDSRFDLHNEPLIASFFASVESQCPACADALKQIVASTEIPPAIPRFEIGTHFVAQ